MKSGHIKRAETTTEEKFSWKEDQLWRFCASSPASSISLNITASSNSCHMTSQYHRHSRLNRHATADVLSLHHKLEFRLFGRSLTWVLVHPRILTFSSLRSRRTRGHKEVGGVFYLCPQFSWVSLVFTRITLVSHFETKTDCVSHTRCDDVTSNLKTLNEDLHEIVIHLISSSSSSLPQFVIITSWNLIMDSPPPGFKEVSISLYHSCFDAVIVSVSLSLIAFLICNSLQNEQ